MHENRRGYTEVEENEMIFKLITLLWRIDFWVSPYSTLIHGQEKEYYEATKMLLLLTRRKCDRYGQGGCSIESERKASVTKSHVCVSFGKFDANTKAQIHK